MPRTDQWNVSWDLGINLTWPLFDGGRSHADAAAASAQADVRRASHRTNSTRGLALEVRQRAARHHRQPRGARGLGRGGRRGDGSAPRRERAVQRRRRDEHGRARRAGRAARGRARAHAAAGAASASTKRGCCARSGASDGRRRRHPRRAAVAPLRQLQGGRRRDVRRAARRGLRLPRRNGAGKSTTIRMLCGLLKPTSGPGRRRRHRRRPRSRGRQAPHRLHVAAVLALRAADRRPEHPLLRRAVRPDAASGCDAAPKFALEMAGLGGRERELARNLSGGWRQRLALGCALLHEPPIIFLDEPTGGVDPVSRREFWRLIDDLSHGGTTVLVTTHYLDEAERCDRVAIIHAGRLAALGTTAELKSAFADRPIFEVRARDPVAAMARARRAARGREDQPVRHGRARGRCAVADERGGSTAARSARRVARSPSIDAGRAVARGRVPRRRRSPDASGAPRETRLGGRVKELRQIRPRPPDLARSCCSCRRSSCFSTATRSTSTSATCRSPSRIATASPRAAQLVAAFVALDLLRSWSRPCDRTPRHRRADRPRRASGRCS